MTAKPKQPRKPAIVRPCGPATTPDDDREEKVRGLARLMSYMPRVVNR